MKKSVKRILCGALSLLMTGTLVAEYALRTNGKEAIAESVSSASSVSFKNVTGQYDTSAMTTANFNDSVLKAEDVAPVYETRTVMVTLSGKTLVDRAGKESVKDYLDTWSGARAQADIASEQSSFLTALNKTGIPYTLERSYDTVLNAVAIEVNTKYVKTLKAMSGVESVVITTAYAEPQTVEYASSGVVTNETDVYKTGIYDSSAYAAKYGEGTVVAVLDTGLDYTHNAFQRFESENVNVAWSADYVESMLKNNTLEAENRSGSLKVNDVYVSAKVPFAYDYADDDADVYPSYSNHGTHVAGIIGGYDTSGYTDKDGNPINETFKGVVPDCQLVICKVFTDDLDDPELGGAVPEDIIAALEDCVTLGVDVINMSLGTSCGFSTTDDGDDEGEMLNAVYNRIQDAGISLVCAASNDYSSGYGGVYGTNLASNPDSGTVGSPSTFSGALSVASINGQKASYLVANGDTDNSSYVFYEESRDIDGNPFDFCNDLQKLYNKTTFEYVVVPGVGHASDYTTAIKRLFRENGNGKSLGRIAVIKRGDTTFQEKVEIAMEMGAAGVIVYNNVAGVIRMNLGEIENPVPAISVTMNAGSALVNGATSRVGTITVGEEYAAGPFMSEFSSWGPTHDLKLKPEITAHGGEITSAVPGGYGEQSGTSMATPNMAGFMALVRSYVEQDLGIRDTVEINRLAMQLTMSTAGTVYDQDGLPYSPRKQGAGVAKLENVIGGTSAYLWTNSTENDYRPKIELGDDPDREGEYELNFNVTNFGSGALTFETEHLVMTETLSSDKLTVAEQAHMLSGTSANWSVTGDAELKDGKITVEKNGTASITVVLRLDTADKAYIENSFENGMYVEGFIKLNSTSESQCDLSIPFLGFYGDWEEAPMLDYSAFEVAANEQDSSVKDEDKIKASVWETLPYNSYYNEKYILPMGGYVYLLADDDDPMYVDEDHCAVSRYNEFYGEGDAQNYMTSTAIKAVYAGLLRNARLVRYSLYNVQTGEVIIENKEVYRVGKAYSGGGAGVPANVELGLSPEEEGLVANGMYKMTFEFFQNEPEEGETAREEDTYEFTFTVDYEAPVLEDVRIRYYNYKENNKEKQRIYLDVDVYDNHYAQSIKLCYPTTEYLDGKEQVVLQLATDYATPVRNANKNGTTTVSIEITDIYESYCKNNPMYLQLDDYAINSCLYELNFSEANIGVLPENGEFALADGEADVTVGIYETHKSALVFSDSYTGSADLSNFTWTSQNPGVASVKNGEIVGLRAGKTKVFVSNGKGATLTINVTVTDEVNASMPDVPNVSFGVIKTSTSALAKAEGVVEVNAGQSFNLPIETDPWYHPQTDLRYVWSTSNEKVATVDQEGNVVTIKKGTAIISAKVEKLNSSGIWESTLYGASVTLKVQNEFTVSNYTLTDYNGLGGVVEIPDDMNIWYIGEEAFKDNNNITKIIIPASVIDINARAFYQCTALEEVYFVSEKHRVDEDGNIVNADVDWSNLAMVYEEAFSGCINLRKIDLTNVKTITVAQDCFKNCPKLEEVVEMQSIGTMHHRAFAGTALTSVDLTGLHMSGENVFAGCTKLESVTTGKFTAIGKNMFKDCTSLTGVVTVSAPRIGEGAFSGCTGLSGVKFESPAGETLNFEIGADAFKNCGVSVGGFTVDFGDEIILSIGQRAFDGAAIKTLDFSEVKGLKFLGADLFANTQITDVVIGDGVDFENLQLSGSPFGGKTVTAASGSTKYEYADGVLYNAGKTKILFVNSSVTGAFTVPASVTEIFDYAFADSNVSSVTLHSGVRAIGAYAFENAALSAIDFGGAALTAIEEGTFYGTKISSVALPETVGALGDYAFAASAIKNFTGNGVTKLGNGVFQSCITLQEIALPDGITSMGDRTFAGCTALTKAALPSVKELGRYTFNGASNLVEASFGENATTTGTYTFAGTPVAKVTFYGNAIKKIGTGTFYQCTSLTGITFPESVTAVEDFAFDRCSALTTVNGLERLESIGMQAFFNTKIEELNLTSAKEIGYMAFAVQSLTGASDAESAYTKLRLPVAESIGNYAFLNSAITGFEVPATLRTLGDGAFASSAKLNAFTVAAGNGTFFVRDGVLYRYINKEAGTYEIVSYPSALVGESVNGKASYRILDGTVRVQAYAFYELNDGALYSVTLPYSLKTIGDRAFYASGISEYTFESIQAPVLESVYDAAIASAVYSLNSTLPYRGYYLANFEKEFYYFTSLGKETSKLTMNYPSNGKGYDNYVYSLYFGVKKDAGALMEDNTRACIALIEDMPDATEVASWMHWEVTEENLATVSELSENVKTARLYYNNAIANEAQAQFITEEHAAKLLAVEDALRDVKAKFGIKVSVREIKVASESTHKTEYKVGETFDMTGLVITVVYDDYSTETADPADVKLITGAFNQYSYYAEVEYQGKRIRIGITIVTDEPPVDSDSSDSDGSENTSSGSGSGCGSVAGGMAGLVTALAACGVALFKKKKD